ncbi:FkbM family methyltransferase [Paraburkholderia dipogonis]|uniref:FkbM family methyltransferase n=1 Tax=Paraburkholderia dipogonis TaxID=1211383 RepID=UPI0038BAD55B
MSITSYAQNFEDVMLWRALAHIDQGSYIDIGAQDPIVDSVSLAFHERGWRGIHVEPTPHYAELLRQQRPGDAVIQAAVGNDRTVLRFFEIPGTGISTADAGIAAQHRDRGFDVREITVPCVPLSAIFEASAGPEIHWLKIDVEGLEREVISSWGGSTARPWIVVVESTLPMTQTESHEDWEAIVVSYGYTAVYFDGLNRYYVSDAHPEIKVAFRAPPNVFDGFVLNGTSTSPFHLLIERRYQEKVDDALAQVESQSQSANSEIENLNVSLASLQKAHVEHEQNWAKREQEIAVHLSMIQHQAAQEKAEQALSHLEQERELRHQQADRENALDQRLQAERDELRHMQQDWAKREQALSEQAGQVQARLEKLLNVVAQRERDVAARLLSTHQQAEREKAELSRSHAEQERALRREHAEQSSQATQVLENLLRDQIRREQEISAQLLGIEQRAAREMGELARCHGEQERALERRHAELEWALIEQYQAAQEAARQQEKEWAQHEKALGKEIADLRSEAQALNFAQQLQAQRHDAELSATVDERSRLIEACAAVEARLKAEISAEQQTSLRLRQSLAHVQDSLATTHASLTWRMTAPLRKLGSFSAFKKHAGSASHVSSKTTAAMMTTVVESQAITGHEAVAERAVPVAAESETPGEAFNETGGSAALHATRPSISELTAINVRNASIESIMLSSTQAIDTAIPAAASTLAELLAHHDQPFVLCAYQTLLGRAPDPEGLGYYLGRLRAGFSKIGLLKQLRLSLEGKAHATNLPGLDAAIQRHQTGQLPLIGWVFGLFNGAESNNPTQRKLRVIENQLFALSGDSNRRFNQMEAALNGLRHLVAQQKQAEDRSPSVASETMEVSAPAPEPEDIEQLSPRARTIYFQLKKAAHVQAERVE